MYFMLNIFYKSTGYLTNMTRTNDAKTAEINERVKHNIECGCDIAEVKVNE